MAGKPQIPTGQVVVRVVGTPLLRNPGVYLARITRISTPQDDLAEVEVEVLARLTQPRGHKRHLTARERTDLRAS